MAALHHYADTMQAPVEFLAFAEYEALASVIRMNSVAFVPGLLQTPEHAREAFALAGVPDVQDQVNRRMERLAVLTRAHPPYISILLSEVALMDIPPGLRLGQLTRLIEAADLPNVSLRLVSVDMGLQVGLEGAFSVRRT